MSCVVCGGYKLEPAFESVTNLAVSSDCRIVKSGVMIVVCSNCSHYQKPIDAHYQKNVAEIYQSYQSYNLSNGTEHLSFNMDVPFARSEKILEHASPYLPNIESAIDVGCGSGVMLSALGNYFDNIVLAGYDLDNNQQDSIRSIPNVSHFYCGDLASVDKKFDLITLIHVLEHIEKPAQFLTDISNLMHDTSVLIIQVPDIIRNPADAMIYDHISHFSRHSLFCLLKNMFPSIEFLPNQLDKEMTVLVRKKEADVQLPVTSSQCTSGGMHQDFDFLTKLETQLISLNDPCTVFSTGPIGTLCGLILGQKLNGFVDEDKVRQGKLHLGTIVTSPELSRQSNIPVFIPFTDDLKEKIMIRLPYLDFV